MRKPFDQTRLGLLMVALLFLTAPNSQAQSALGNALSFNGTTQSVTVSNFGAIIPTNEITVEFWADAGKFSTQSAFMLDPDQNANRFNVHVDYGSTSGQTFWDFGNINGSVGRLSVNSPVNSINNWVHYALVASMSSNSMSIYTNGVLQTSKSGMTPFVRGSYNLQIGGPGFPFNGSLDELRVWSVARTPAQIQSDLYTPLTGNEANLVVYYKFDSTGGNVATNSANATGPAYNGILNNSPSWVSSTIPIPVNPVSNLGDNGAGSLRFAATNLAAGSTITFAGALSGQSILLTGGQIELTRNVTINASALANGMQINGNGNSRIFQVDSGVTVSLNSLTLTNGQSHGNDASFTGGDGGDGMGGGIYNLGTLTVSNCTIANDTAGGGNAESGNGGNGFGGGIYNSGTLTVNSSALISNFATGGAGSEGGGGNGFGAGVYNTGTLNLNNSTLAGNNASGGSAFDGFGNGGSGAGGAIYNSQTMALNNDTFVNNSANGQSAGFSGNAGSGTGGGIFSSILFHVTNSIICSNIAGTSANLSGSFTTANNLLNVDPLLAPLGNYGGPTQTMPPEPNSPAINAGHATFLITDQRGLTRSVGTTDIGSVEVQSGENFPIVFTIADSGDGSLRQVLSNTPPGATITFAPSLGGQTILLTGGQFVLTNTTIIDATKVPGGITINGNGTSRIFTVNSSSLAIIGGLNLTNGNPGSGNFGGAIFNGGTLELISTTLAGNTSAQGGGIENEGTLIMNSCTLTGNHTTSNGGAIDNNAGPLNLVHCTIVSNSATSGGGGAANFNTTLSMTNCIIAGNTAAFGPDLDNFSSSTINAGGSNIVQNSVNNGTLNGAGTFIAKAPLLSPLGFYGGFSFTMPPLPGSPAIDNGVTAIDIAANNTLDQRGYPRVSGAQVDIGAVEVQIASAPFALPDLTQLGNGSVHFAFTNLIGGSFSVFATTNVTRAFSTWSNLGTATESPTGSGQFQFTDTKATNFPSRFYRLRSP